MVKDVKQKLNDKIKALNSTRVFKKITPQYELTWYIKWSASLFLLLGMALVTANIQPLQMIVSLVGVVGWLVVGMMWHDRALIFINGIACFIYTRGLIKYFHSGL